MACNLFMLFFNPRDEARKYLRDAQVCPWQKNTIGAFSKNYRRGHAAERAFRFTVRHDFFSFNFIAQNDSEAVLCFRSVVAQMLCTN